MDIRMATYEEDVADLLEGIDQNIITVGDPDEEISRHGLKRCDNANVDEHPTGTWFYYPGDGTVAVREP